MSEAEIARYTRDGFLVIRGRLDDHEIKRCTKALERQPFVDGAPRGVKYPEPGRYTLARSCMADPS